MAHNGDNLFFGNTRYNILTFRLLFHRVGTRIRLVLETTCINRTFIPVRFIFVTQIIVNKHHAFYVQGEVNVQLGLVCKLGEVIVSTLC